MGPVKYRRKSRVSVSGWIWVFFACSSLAHGLRLQAQLQEPLALRATSLSPSDAQFYKHLKVRPQGGDEQAEGLPYASAPAVSISYAQPQPQPGHGSEIAAVLNNLIEARSFADYESFDLLPVHVKRRDPNAAGPELKDGGGSAGIGKGNERENIQSSACKSTVLSSDDLRHLASTATNVLTGKVSWAFTEDPADAGTSTLDAVAPEPATLTLPKGVTSHNVIPNAKSARGQCGILSVQARLWLESETAEAGIAVVDNEKATAYRLTAATNGNMQLESAGGFVLASKQCKPFAAKVFVDLSLTIEPLKGRVVGRLGRCSPLVLVGQATPLITPKMYTQLIKKNGYARFTQIAITV